MNHSQTGIEGGQSNWCNSYSAIVTTTGVKLMSMGLLLNTEVSDTTITYEKEGTECFHIHFLSYLQNYPMARER